MEINEAIELIRLTRMESIGESKERYNQVIALLKSLEDENKELKKYKQMWRDLYQNWKNNFIAYPFPYSNSMGLILEDKMEELEQKYLKEATND